MSCGIKKNGRNEKGALVGGWGGRARTPRLKSRREKGKPREEVFLSSTTAAATKRQGKPSRRSSSKISLRLGNSLFFLSFSTHLSAGVPTPFPLVGPARPGGRRQVAQAKALAGRRLRGGGGDEDDAAAGGDRRRASRRRRRRRERRAAVGRDGRHLFFFSVSCDRGDRNARRGECRERFGAEEAEPGDAGDC